MVKYKKLWVVVSACILVMGLLAGCGKANESESGTGSEAGQEDPLASFPGVTLPYQVAPDTALAEYEGGKVTALELENFLRTLNFLQPGQAQFFASMPQDILRSFIREYTGTKILSARASEAHNTEAKQLAENTFEQVKQQYMMILNNDENMFEKMLENQKLDKQTVVDQMTMINSSLYVLKDGISDEEVQKFYEETDKAEFTIASVRHILISTEERSQEEAKKLADELVERLRNGEDFAQLANEYTDDPGSKETGGLYENAPVTDWVPEFRDAAVSLPLNEISDPVETDFGYHIMRVEKRTVQTFDEVKEKLKGSNEMIEHQYEKFLTEEVDKMVTNWNIPEVSEQQ